MSEILPFHDNVVPDKAEIEQDLQSVFCFAQKFIDVNGLDYQDGFQSLKPTEMYDLGIAILKSPSVIAAYDLISETPSDGSLSYYDRLIAEPQHLQTYKILDHALASKEPHRVERAIDIATGNGFCAMLLSQYADHISAVDVSAGMLRVAGESLERLYKTGNYMKTYETRQMSATTLDYPDEYFDIATSNAFTNYITYDEQEKFYREVHRILKPGGRYYEPQQNNSDSNSFYFKSPRGRLAQIIVEALLSLRDPSTKRGGDRTVPTIDDFGFDSVGMIYQNFPFIRQVIYGIKN